MLSTRQHRPFVAALSVVIASASASARGQSSSDAALPEAGDNFRAPPVDWLARSLAPETRRSIDSSLPTGRTLHGLRIPRYFPTGEKGKAAAATNYESTSNEATLRLSSVTTCTTATRVDDDHIYTTDFLHTIYNPDGTLQLKIQLRDAIIDLRTTIVSTEKPVIIHRAGQTIHGTALIHDGKTGFTSIAQGHVRPTIP